MYLKTTLPQNTYGHYNPEYHNNYSKLILPPSHYVSKTSVTSNRFSQSQVALYQWSYWCGDYQG